MESFLLGRMRRGVELAMVEDHLAWCADCIARCKQTSEYIQLMRAALVEAAVAGECA
jgi:hypothetical protein